MGKPVIYNLSTFPMAHFMLEYAVLLTTLLAAHLGADGFRLKLKDSRSDAMGFAPIGSSACHDGCGNEVDPAVLSETCALHKACVDLANDNATRSLFPNFYP